MRLASIALVVLIHVLSPFYDAGSIMLGDLDVVRLLSRSIRFVVPAFVMLAGALAWTRDVGADSGDAAGWGAYLRRRGRTVLAPYLVWSAVYMLLAPRIETASLEAVGDALAGLVLGTTWYHLYFVPIILGVYLLAPLASRIYRKVGGGAVLLVALVVGLVLPAEAVRLGLRGDLAVDVVVLVATYLPFAGVGAWYASVRTNVRWQAIERVAWLPLLAGGVALRVWFGAVRPWPADPYLAVALNILMNVVQCLGLFGLARVLTRPLPAVIDRATSLAPFVFGVYLSHPLVIEALLPLTTRGPVPAGLWVVLAWPLVTAVCFGAMRWVSRYRWLWWLHGVNASGS